MLNKHISKTYKKKEQTTNHKWLIRDANYKVIAM